MTAANCLKCGAEKFGALTPCLKCGFTPHSDTDQAKSILLSDHFLSREELRTKSELIQDGQPLDFPEDQIEAFLKVFSNKRPSFKSDTFYTKCTVLLTLWVISAILILIYVQTRWVKALAGGLLFVTIFPTIVLWADILEPLRRKCRACGKRGVTQGTTSVFQSRHTYDKWNFCRNCSRVYFRVNGQWLPQDEPEIPS